MFWIRSGFHGISMSISDWLTAAPAVAADPSVALEGARRAMLEALGQAGARQRATLEVRIRMASNAQVLWELRPELMTIASQLHGELEGRKRLAHVTSLFESLLTVAASGRKRRPVALAGARH
jgi:hypothetical protein